MELPSDRSPIPETTPPTQLRSPFHRLGWETEKPGEGHKQDGRGPDQTSFPQRMTEKTISLPCRPTGPGAPMETLRSRDRPSTPTLPRGTGRHVFSHGHSCRLRHTFVVDPRDTWADADHTDKQAKGTHITRGRHMRVNTILHSDV